MQRAPEDVFLPAPPLHSSPLELLRPEDSEPPQRLAHVPTSAEHDGFLEFVPPAGPNGELPIALVFLHGLGERGNGDSDLDRILRNGPPKLVQDGEWPGRDSVAVFAPQNSGPERCHRPDRVRRFLEHIRETYADRVDVEHIILAGYSCGGHAGWNYLARFHEDPWIQGLLLASGSPLRNENGAHPEEGESTALELLAARAPGDLVPIRIAFGESDSVVPPDAAFPSQALERANVDGWADRLAGVGHGTSTPYFRRDDILDWILAPRHISPAPEIAMVSP